MAEVLGFGLSHFPGPLVPAELWPRMLKSNVEKGRIPAEVYANQSAWPAAMRAEWGNDEGVTAAHVHQKALLAGYREIRRRIDDFKPDLIVIWGDDQYENFQKDGVPAFCTFIFDEISSTPFAGGERGPYRTDRNTWNLPPDTPLTVRGHREAAHGLTSALLHNQFDVAYAFDVRHARGLAHAFANTIVFLDDERKGFPYPVLPFHVNCYGRQMMKTAAKQSIACPPSPSPARCFDIGAATARYFRDSPWRVALIGSSSWSHGSLTEKHQRLYPDIAADRCRLEELKAGQYQRWKDLDLGALEDAGQHEFLNWVCLAGAMAELKADVEVIDYVESHLFNSSKCFAAFTPTKQG